MHKPFRTFRASRCATRSMLELFMLRCQPAVSPVSTELRGAGRPVIEVGADRGARGGAAGNASRPRGEENPGDGVVIDLVSMERQAASERGRPTG